MASEVRRTGRRRASNGDRQFRSHNGFEPGSPGGKMKTRDPVHPVPIEQRDRRIAEIRRALDERLRQRRTVQK